MSTADRLFIFFMDGVGSSNSAPKSPELLTADDPQVDPSPLNRLDHWWKLSGVLPTDADKYLRTRCRHQKSTRQQKANATGYRTERSLMGCPPPPPLLRGTKQPISVLEQILSVGRV